MGEILFADEWIHVTLQKLLNQKTELRQHSCEICGRSAGARKWWYSVRTRRLRCPDCFDPGKGLLRQPRLGFWNEYGATLEQTRLVTGNDRVLLQQAIARIMSANVWREKYQQDPATTIQVVEQDLLIRGLVTTPEGKKEWWTYSVNLERLREGGAGAIARDFLANYDKTRS